MSEVVQDWVAAPQNTARSVLVTIFGDTIVPVTSSVWLAQLFQLTDTFGFTARLVRTSLFRLAAEGWFTNDRVGRQSRYSLTPLAIEESEQASTRIYQSPDPNWAGSWTVLFLNSPGVPSAVADQLSRYLRWHGFVTLARGVLASPTASVQSTKDLCRLVVPEVRVPLGSLDFAELEAIVADGFFTQALGLDEMSTSYKRFIRFYEAIDPQLEVETPDEAFALRTMLVHDLRRIRLSGPDIPAALLPTDWPGSVASETAARLYPRLSELAAPWLSQVLETTYPDSVAKRFSVTERQMRRGPSAAVVDIRRLG